MQNLVVAILAIVLAIAVGLAGLSYLGPSYTNGMTEAQVAQFLNGSQQVAGAQSLWAAEHGGAWHHDDASTDAVADFVSAGYLSAKPVVPGALGGGSTWSVVRDRNDAHVPLIAVPTHGDAKALAAFCAALSAKTGGRGGCTTDVGTLALVK